MQGQEAEWAEKAIFHGVGKKRFSLQRVALPVAKNGEALVRMRLATICGSDHHTISGRRQAPTPCVLGHEGVGVVEAVGEGRDSSWIGKRVTWSLADSCGKCEACQSWNLPQKCENLFKYGHASCDDGSGLNGCYASHILLRSGTHLVEVPSSLSDSVVAPANCALATMFSVAEPLLENVPRRLLIQGGGLLGVYGAALFSQQGVEVWLSDPDEGRRHLAREFGTRTVSVSELAAVPDGFFDAIVEVAGVASVVSEGLRLLRIGGHYVWAGMVHDATELNFRGVDVVKGCFRITGIHNYRPGHLDAAIRFLAETKDQYPWEKLVSPPLPLASIEAACTLSEQRKWHRVSVAPQSL